MLLGSSMLASGAANASAYAVSTNSITGFAVTFDTSKATLKSNTLAADTAELFGEEVFYGALKDGAPACLDCVYDNSFVSHGAASSYAYGDTQIANASVVAGAGAASSIGEASLLSAGTGHAYGSNTLTGTWTNLSVSTPLAVTFSFSATPYMQAVAAGAGDFATAESAMIITLVKGSTTFFSWAPTELNRSFTSTGGTQAYTPGALNFTNTTVLLSPGAY